ncbi:hypothetical protein [Parasitella parasitica]|uniref:Uncharacterized protein n=1 Tax=Parasitella parasitica TaxID=35722 RepID=A0A0B7MYH2_9FUNG|nr:hypothetical protein [Parasitella parasitica]
MSSAITTNDLQNVRKSLRKSNFFKETNYKLFAGWTELQSIEETSSSMYTLCILKNSTNTFINMSRIWLNLVHIHDIHTLEAMDQLTEGLKNAPNLVDLTIQHSRLNLAHFDSINQKCPLLQKLTLHSIMLFKHRTWEKPATESNFIIDGDISENIAATSNLQCLSITDSTFEKDLLLFSYISENYRNLYDLTCYNHTCGIPTYSVDSKSAVNVLHECRHLKNFKSNFFEWTGPFIDLVDQHTETTLQEFKLDISDWTANTFMSLCRSIRLRRALKYFTFNFYEVPESLDTNILVFVNLVELHINFDCYLDNDDAHRGFGPNEEIPVPPPIPFTSLLQSCRSLNYLSIGHLPIIVDRMPFENHSIQTIHLTGCSLESFERKYSIYNYISNFCPQLVDLEIEGGNYKNSPSIKELTLDLINHRRLCTLTPLTNNVYRHIKHMDENNWYLVSQIQSSSTYQVYHTLVRPSFDVVKSRKYITIRCKNRSLFYLGDEGIDYYD